MIADTVMIACPYCNYKNRFKVRNAGNFSIYTCPETHGCGQMFVGRICWEPRISARKIDESATDYREKMKGNSTQ